MPEPQPPFRADHIPNPTELENLLRRAATFDGLQTCWEVVRRSFDTPRFLQNGEVRDLLKLVADCFSKPPYECDSGVKKIWEGPELRAQLKELGVPEEFLLHTVRVGALKGALARAEAAPDRAVPLPADGTVMYEIVKVLGNRLSDPAAENSRLLSIIRDVLAQPTLDGYSWANAELDKLTKARVAGDASKVEAARAALEVKKEQAIGAIYTNMRQPGFRLQSEQVSLLRDDFERHLTRWRGFIQGRGAKQAQALFMQKGNQVIDRGLFQEFRSSCASLVEADFPWDIMNPDSGWFAVLLINNATTVSNFISDLNGNMNSWFRL